MINQNDFNGAREFIDDRINYLTKKIVENGGAGQVVSDHWFVLLSNLLSAREAMDALDGESSVDVEL